MRHIAGSIARMLGHPPVPEQVLADTCAAAYENDRRAAGLDLSGLAAGDGKCEIKEISENSGAVRRFNIIGYGDFEGPAARCGTSAG